MERSIEEIRGMESATGGDGDRRVFHQLFGLRGYTFPPFTQVKDCLSKIRRESVSSFDLPSVAESALVPPNI